jgi:DnaJ like chaperone protein
MSVWSRLGDVAQSINDVLGGVFSQLSRKSAVPEKSVGFTIGMIALGAKMARADGVVVASEIAAFKEVFEVPAEDMAAVDRIFDLAKQDTAGFESYATQVARLFSKKSSVLENVLDGLFHIAKADDAIHEDEIAYLRQVAEIFGFSSSDFQRIQSRHVTVQDDPYEILGVAPDTSMKDIRARYKKLVRDLHPDKQIAAGVPEELVKLATDRLARINDAYARIAKST